MSYKIEKVLNDVPGKFVAMVSFNGRPAERYEVESLEAKVIAETLEKVSVEVQEIVVKREAEVAILNAIEIKDGQIVI